MNCVSTRILEWKLQTGCSNAVSLDFLSTCMVYSVDDRIYFLRNLPGLISVGKQRAQAALFF